MKMQAIMLIVGFLAFGIMLAGMFWKPKSDFKSKEIMTENEKDFFLTLVMALPDHHVFPQVAMSAILDTNVKEFNKKKHVGLRNKFSQKVCDYIVCDHKLNVIAIVELDDRTHKFLKDKERDNMLKQGGYKPECLLRYESKKKPDAAMIASDIAKIVTAKT